ncbi:MAG: M50 family metallopeptidase [Kiritimatiellae bacterium]|nr:M50 family metallopeptidase [Kiritimatiellia bacterium]
MFSSTNFQVCKVFGVPVKADISLILIAGMLVHSYVGSASFGAALVAGLLATASLLLALFVHEVGHALAALHFSSRVYEITLMFFGGYAKMSDLPSDPLKRAAISLAGPAAGLLLWFLAPIAAGLPAMPRFLAFMLGAAAHFSIALSVFNLIPALPLDGGLALRDIVANFKGRAFATFLSARLSFGIAVAMGLYGLLFARSIFLVFIAFFVWSAAKTELARSAAGEDDPDILDDDIVVISPPPYGKEKEYTRKRRG